MPQMLDLARHESVGATFALLIDSSASMSRRLDFVQRTAGRLADYMRRSIGRSWRRSPKPAADDGTHRRSARRWPRRSARFRAGGGTAILDSLIQLARSFPESPGRRAVILITDGYDENSNVDVDEAIAAREGGARHGVCRWHRRCRRCLVEGREDAAATRRRDGRTGLHPSDGIELELVHTALVEEVRNRYLLTYTPTNQDQDGKWREISVMCRSRLSGGRAPGYFAPKPAPVRPREFTATDPRGRTVSTADDLEVIEDGVPQQVETFHEASQPVSIVLALDASGSMRHREADVIASARAFAAALRPEDQAGGHDCSPTTSGSFTTCRQS